MIPVKKCGHRCVAAGPGSDMDAKGFWVTVGLIGPEQKVPQTRAQVTYFYSNQHRFDVHSVGVVCMCLHVRVCVCAPLRGKSIMGLFSQLVPDRKGPQEVSLKPKVNSVRLCLRLNFTSRTIKIRNIRLAETKATETTVRRFLFPKCAFKSSCGGKGPRDKI